MRLTRRAALQTVGVVAATLYGEPVAAKQGRVMNLVLDDIARIEVRYRGRVVAVDPAAVVDALSGASGKGP